MQAVTLAREWLEEATRAYDQKFAEVAETEEADHDATKCTLEKTDALENNVTTATMKADSLAATEADFFQTLIERKEECLRELNVLYCQLCQPRSTQR